MCVCTRQASVTYNWRVSGADTGPDSVHPQHELPAPVTGRICVSNIYIYYGADPEVWERWLPDGGWMALKIVMNQAPSPGRPGASHLQQPQRCCCRFNQNSLIVQSFSPEGDFCWLSKTTFPSVSVLGRYVYTWVNRASLLKQWSGTCLFRRPNDLITKCGTHTRDPSAWTWDPSTHETYLSLAPHTSPQESAILLDRRKHCTTGFGRKVLTLPFGSFVCESSPNCLGVRFRFPLYQTAHECLLTWGKVLLIIFRFHSR